MLVLVVAGRENNYRSDPDIRLMERVAAGEKEVFGELAERREELATLLTAGTRTADPGTGCWVTLTSSRLKSRPR